MDIFGTKMCHFQIPVTDILLFSLLLLQTYGIKGEILLYRVKLLSNFEFEMQKYRSELPYCLVAFHTRLDELGYCMTDTHYPPQLCIPDSDFALSYRILTLRDDIFE